MQTPVLVSLVKKDAAMLDAFGKGASEDIRRTKEELYRALTRDPATGEFHYKHSGDKKLQSSLPVSPNRVRILPSALYMTRHSGQCRCGILFCFSLRYPDNRPMEFL